MFVLIDLNQNDNTKRFEASRFPLPRGAIKNYYIIINGKNLKWYQGIRKITTGQGEDYTTGCLLDYEYIKNHYKQIAVDLSRQKELDVNLKAIQ